MGDSTPVVVELDGVVGAEVRAFVETELGWQVVARDGGLRPVLALGARPTSGTACAVVVDGTPSIEEVREALQGGALDVLGWPGDRHRLVEMAGLARAVADPKAAMSTFVVGGAAGGVGTSTVALAVAGLLAWSGAQVVAVGDDGMLRLAGVGPWEGPGAVEVSGLDPAAAAVEVATLSRAVPAVPGLRLLGGGPVREVAGWPADVVVIDAGRTGVAPADLLCARPDAHLACVGEGVSPVLLVGEGPLDAGAARRVLGRRPAGVVAASARVARAGVAGRVPDGLPGRWLADLRAVLGALG